MQLAIVMDGTELCGIVTLADIVKHVLPVGVAALQTPAGVRPR